MAMFLMGLALLVVYCFSCLSTGGLILRAAGGRGGFWRGGNHTPAARAATAFLLGSGVLANVWLLLSLPAGGWFTRWTVGGILALCLAAGVRMARRELVSFCRQFASAVSRLVRREHWTWKIIGLAVLVLVVMYGLSSALPPKGDAAAFYMALPKLISCTHQLIPMPGYETFTQIGLHGEMHFAALISLGSDQAATMFVFAVGLAMCVMLLEIARRAGLAARGRWIVLAMVFTSTAVTRVIPGGKVDLFGSAMAMAALYWVLEVADRRYMRAAALAGLFAGFAVVAKLSLLGTLVPMVGILALWRVALSRRQKRRNVLAGMGLSVLLLLVAAAVAMGPHLLKNGLLFGEPLAPLPYVSSGQSWLKQDWLSPQAAGRLLRIYPLALFLGKFPGMHGSMSVLILAFSPLLLLRPWPGLGKLLRNTLVQLTLVSVLAVAAWAVFQTSVFAPRYFLPPLLLLMLLPARAAELAASGAPRCLRVGVGPPASLKRAGQKSMPRCLRVGIVICMVMALAATFNRPKCHPGKALGYISGRYTQAEVGDFPARQGEVLNGCAAVGERVFMGSPFSYFLRPDLLVSINGQAELADLRALSTHEQRWKYLYNKGFRYIMVAQRGSLSADGRRWVTRREADGYSLDTARTPPRLELTPIFREGKKQGPILHVIYEIRETPVDNEGDDFPFPGGRSHGAKKIIGKK